MGHPKGVCSTVRPSESVLSPGIQTCSPLPWGRPPCWTPIAATHILVFRLCSIKFLESIIYIQSLTDTHFSFSKKVTQHQQYPNVPGTSRATSFPSGPPGGASLRPAALPVCSPDTHTGITFCAGRSPGAQRLVTAGARTTWLSGETATGKVLRHGKGDMSPPSETP